VRSKNPWCERFGKRSLGIPGAGAGERKCSLTNPSHGQARRPQIFWSPSERKLDRHERRGTRDTTTPPHNQKPANTYLPTLLSTWSIDPKERLRPASITHLAECPYGYSRPPGRSPQFCDVEDPFIIHGSMPQLQQLHPPHHHKALTPRYLLFTTRQRNRHPTSHPSSASPNSCDNMPLFSSPPP